MTGKNFIDLQDVNTQIDLNRHGVIEASAGTGKTYTIMRIVLRLLVEKRLNLEEILLVTYTEKAAGEMKDRIRQLLEDELRRTHPHDVRAHLQRQLEQIDNAQVYTIHAFCNNLLQRRAFENREHFELVMEDAGPLYAQELYRLLRVRYPQGDKEQLLELYRHSGVDRLLLKDPGVFAKVASEWDRERQVLHGIRADEGEQLDPHALLVAVKQIVADYRQQFGTGLWGSDPEGAYRLSDRSREGLNGTKGPKFIKILSRVLEGLDALKRMDSAACESGQVLGHLTSLFLEDPLVYLGGTFYKKGFEADQERYSDFWEHRLKPELRWVSERFVEISWRLYSDLRFCIVNEIQQRAEAEKRARGLLGFDDMLQLVGRAVAAGDGNNPLTESLRREYRYALIDEFQDTDGVQWDIFSNVFLNGSGEHASRLFLIGDPKQAIYSFRGAELNTYFAALRQMEALPAAEVTFYRLLTNWRSAPKLIEATNRLFGDENWFQHPSIDFVPSRWPDANLRCTPFADNSGAPPVSVIHFIDDKIKPRQFNVYAADWMAGEIRRLIDNRCLEIPDEQHPEQMRALRYGDICILMRTRSRLSVYEKALHAAGIPFSFYKKPKLYESNEALQLHCLLASLAEPENRDKMKLAGLTSFFDEFSGVDPLLNDPFDDAQGNRRREVYETWLRLADEERWPELFAGLMGDTGLSSRLICRPDGERSLANFQQIFEDLLETAVNSSLDKVELAERLAECRNSKSGSDEDDLHRRDSEGSRVQLMTMHASKGLEFPVVFLAPDSELKNLTDEYFRVSSPTKKTESAPEAGQGLDERLRSGLYWREKEALAEKAKAAMERGQQEEFRRLYYVAVTRPVYRLYLFTKAGKLDTKGKKQKKQIISDFLTVRLENLGLTGSGEFTNEMKGLIRVTGYLQKRLTNREHDAVEVPEQLPLQGAELPAAKRPAVERHRELLTSFSSLSRFASQLGMEWHAEEEPELRSDDEPDSEQPAAEEIPELSGDLLFPRGAAPGSMLHELFEQLDWNIVRNCRDAAALAGDPVFAELAETRLDRWRIKPNRTPEELAQLTGEAARMVWNALRLPVALPDDGSVILAELEESARLAEKEFYLYFETDNGGGYLNGIIDLVFRYQNKYYILDWKSNWLPGYAEGHLKQCMEHHNYFLQMKIYSLAVMEWLENLGCKEDDFGGAVYLFLRGADLDKKQTAGYPQQFKRQDVEDVRSKLLKYDVEKQEALG